MIDNKNLEGIGSGHNAVKLGNYMTGFTLGNTETTFLLIKNIIGKKIKIYEKHYKKTEQRDKKYRYFSIVI